MSPSVQPVAPTPDASPLQLQKVLMATTSPEVCRQVMQRSLSLAGLSQVPGDNQALRNYVEGPLRRVLTQTVGVHVAGAVFASLQPLLERIEPVEREEDWNDFGTSDLMRLHVEQATAQITRFESLRRQPPAGRVVAPPQPMPPSLVPSNTPVAPVLLVSSDHVGIQRALKQLRPLWQPQPIASLEQLLAELRQTEASPRPLVVLDCSMPSLQLDELLQRRQALAGAKRIIVWGITARRRKDLESQLAPDLSRWTMLPMFVGYRELADTLVALAEDGH